MNLTFLVIGIIVTGLSLLSISIFSITNFALKRLNKEKQMMKTAEEKQKEKTVKRVMKYSKKFIKKVNRVLVENYIAYYSVSAALLSAGVVATSVSAVNIAKDIEAKNQANVPSEVIPSEDPVTPTDPISPTDPVTPTTPEIDPSVKYTVTYYQYGRELYTLEVSKNDKAPDPRNPFKESDRAIFEYWSLSENNPSPYDFNSIVTSDINLYAIADFNVHWVNYYFDDTLVAESLLREGEFATNVRVEQSVIDEYIDTYGIDYEIDYYWMQEYTQEEFDFENTPITNELCGDESYDLDLYAFIYERYE